MSAAFCCFIAVVAGFTRHAGQLRMVSASHSHRCQTQLYCKNPAVKCDFPQSRPEIHQLLYHHTVKNAQIPIRFINRALALWCDILLMLQRLANTPTSDSADQSFPQLLPETDSPFPPRLTRRHETDGEKLVI